MTRPLADIQRARIIRELTEQDQTDAQEWDALSDKKLVEALNYNRQRKLQALASTITESEQQQ